MAEKRIGIVGGMGPEATIDLFSKITAATPAKKDQDHIRVIIDSNPKVPSRQKAILENGPSPIPLLTETARNLEKAGADVLVVACYLSHYYIGDIKRSVKIPVLDLIEEAGKHLREQYPKARRVGLLASIGAVKTKLFEKKLADLGLSVVVPDDPVQDKLNEAMNEIKSGMKGSETRSKVTNALEHLKRKGAEVAMIGCTEFPLVLENVETTIPVVDPATIAAHHLSRIGKGGDELSAES